MKRYVREFAADVRKSFSKAPAELRENVDRQIQSLLELLEMGLISDFETVETLLNIPKRL